MEGCLIAAGFVSLGLLTKAVLEAAYFKDRMSAKQSLCLWLVAICSIGFALGLALLINYLG